MEDEITKRELSDDVFANLSTVIAYPIPEFTMIAALYTKLKKKIC